MTFNEIDIGNVRGIQGEKGDKGDKGNTPSLTDLKYDKQNGEFVTKKGNGNIVRYTITINGEEIECYMDKEGHLCNSEGYLIIDGELTEQQGVPFDIEEYGYEYLPLKIDEDNNLLNNNGEMIDDKGNVLYVESSFIGDIANYIYHDTDGYNQLIQSVYPYIVDTLVSADPTDEKYKNFFKEIEGDIKYYICADNPKLTIYMEDNDLHNTCKYKDGNGELVVDEDTGEYAFVPLEKNALYLYNAHSDAVDNEIMHYDIYLCTFANTVPKKLISANDFNIDYNVIDDFLLDVKDSVTDDEKEVYLKLFTRGTRGQFYSMSDVDTLFDDNVISKLGAVNGIAQLNNDGKVPLSQLPTVIEKIIEGTMDNSGVFTPSDNSESDLVERESYVYLDISNGNSYRWSGSTYVYIGNTNDLDRQIDSELDEDSVHAVENGVITSKFNEIQSNQITANISLNHSLRDLSDDVQTKYEQLLNYMPCMILTVTGSSFNEHNNNTAINGSNIIVDYGDGTIEPLGNRLNHSYTDGLNTHTIKIYGVTSLGNHCFDDCTGLTSITIPPSITSLGYCCFYICTGLTNISIPSSVTSIGDYCFTDCTGLTNINIPSSVTSIGNCCFTDCTGLTNINIPSSVTSIGDYCFTDCTGLTNINIPSSVTSIGNCCFEGCTGLGRIYLNWSNSTKIIGYDSRWITNAPVNFYVPIGTISTYTSKGYPSDKLKD